MGPRPKLPPEGWVKILQLLAENSNGGCTNEHDQQTTPDGEVRLGCREVMRGRGDDKEKKCKR